MLILTNTTDNIQLVLWSSVTTNQLDIVSCWRDVDMPTDTVFTPWRTVSASNNTTDVNIVTAPASWYQRIVDTISVYNKDTTTKTVTIKFDANWTEYIIAKVDLYTLERLEYSEWEWVRIFTSQWALKTTQTWGNNPISSSTTTVILGSDVVNNNAVANTIADVTGLSFAVTNWNTYWYRASIAYTANATTTWSRRAVNWPTGTLIAMSRYALTTTTETLNYGVTAFNSPAASNATSASTSGNNAILEWIFTATANGTFIIRFASEVASAAITAKAGSILEYQQVL